LFLFGSLFLLAIAVIALGVTPMREPASMLVIAPAALYVVWWGVVGILSLDSLLRG